MNCRKSEPLKFLNGEDITKVNEFVYLRATVSDEGGGGGGGEGGGQRYGESAN